MSAPLSFERMRADLGESNPVLHSEFLLSLKHPARHKRSFVSSKDGIVQGYFFPPLGMDAGSIVEVPAILICHEAGDETGKRGRHGLDALTRCLWEELSCPGNEKLSQKSQAFPSSLLHGCSHSQENPFAL